MMRIRSIEVRGDQPQVTIKPAPVHAGEKQQNIEGDKRWDKSTPITTVNTKKIYNKDDTGAAGAPSAYLRKPGSNFELHFTVDNVIDELESVPLTKLKLSMFIADDHYSQSGREDGGKSGILIFSTEKWIPEGNTTNVTFVWSLDTVMPYGLFGTYSFDIAREYSNGHMSMTNGRRFEEKLPLEFYLLPVFELPSVFEKDGRTQIPLLLLRMFVLPPVWRWLENKQSTWVETCTKIVFGTLKPFSGAPSLTENHWLRYNTVNGQTAFSAQYGDSGFNIGFWLDAYRVWSTFDKQPDVQRKHTQLINCYDCAAATEYALCLGIPHTQVNWEYHQVYGFIDSSLVGRGHCNNPYPGNDSELYLKNPNDEKRSPFHNHAYLSWSSNDLTMQQYNTYNDSVKEVGREEYQRRATEFEKSLPSRLFMIDACAGPAIGTETREVYEGQVLAVGDPEKSNSNAVKKDIKKYKKEDHSLGRGISILESTLGWKKQLSEEQWKSFSKISEDIEKWLGGVDLETGIGKSDVYSVQTIFEEFVLKRSDWTQLQPIPVRDYVTAHDIVVSEIKYSFMDNKAQSQTISLRISRSKISYLSHLINGLAGHLAYLALTSVVGADIKVWDEMTVGTEKHVVNIIGSEHGRAFRWQNAAVEMNTTADDAWETVSENHGILGKLLDKIVELQKTAEV